MSETVNWTASFRKNPLPWLLEEQDPAVRHLALRQLCDLPAEHPEVLRASRESMSSDPIAAMLAAQSAEGYWVKPGAGYGPKYTGTVWQLIFLDQLGADPGHPGIVKGCEYALSHTQTST
ncbi:MAG: nitrogen fixation protein NifH, partial [Thermomicrobiales bacterium]